MRAARPAAVGLETHLTILAQLIEEFGPAVAVLDGLAGLIHGSSAAEVASMVARQIDLLKSRGITTLATTLADESETSTVGISSLVDTWLLLRNTESDGERNRLLYVLKSRGSAHSNQVREFLLTGHGVELADVYVGPAGVVTGSARLAQEARERDAKLQRDEDLMRRRRELRRAITEGEAQLAVLQDELAAEKAEAERIDERQQRQATDAEADRSAMASRRWADPVPREERGQR
jgi:circadian clock protein KaiC